VSRSRRILIGGSITLLAVTALGAVPAAAADNEGTLAIVQGVPGKRLDVCINGTEIRSGLRYGQVVLRDEISNGEKVIKFYSQDPRNCRGNLHAQHDGLNIVAGSDYTVVVTKNAPKIVTFNNMGAGEIPPAGAPIAANFIFHRHAAEPLANIFLRYWAPSAETPISPTANPLWGKGQQWFVATPSQDWIWRVRATQPENPQTMAVKTATLGTSRRYEFILLGSNAGNAKWVLLNRRISAPSP
jgi:hypothetical protein